MTGTGRQAQSVDPRKKMGAEAPDWLADFKTPRLLGEFCEFFYLFNIE